MERARNTGCRLSTSSSLIITCARLRYADMAGVDALSQPGRHAFLSRLEAGPFRNTQPANRDFRRAPATSRGSPIPLICEAPV
jgi:hypothetical protein